MLNAFRRMINPYSLTVIIMLLEMGDAFARAGGPTNSSSEGGGIATFLAIILTPFFIIYSYFVTRASRKKEKQNAELLKALALHNTDWEIVHLKNRVEVCFLKVESGWNNRDVNISKNYLSEGLYRDHLKRIEEMKRNNIRNYIKRPSLDSMRIVQIDDNPEMMNDSFWAHMTMSMIDYTVDTTDEKILKGSPDTVVTSEELWKFIFNGKDWVVDQINRKVDIKTLKRFKSTSVCHPKLIV